MPTRSVWRSSDLGLSVPTSLRRSVAERARQVLASNRRRGISDWGGRHYDFVCPSPESYPFQWFWDSCFHAIALCDVDVRLAEQELAGLFQAASPDGFIPHIVLWERAHHESVLATYCVSFADRWRTATIQPPVLALAVERIADSGGSAGFLRKAVPTVWRYFDWLARNRDPDDSGLIVILQPDESGMDASPKYDRSLGLETPDDAGLKHAMGNLIGSYTGRWQDPASLIRLDRFVWTDVLVNSIYLQGLASLARLLEVAEHRTGKLRPSNAIALTRERRARGLQTLLKRCWDPRRGAFFDYVGFERRPVQCLTISSLMPLILDDLPQEIVQELVERHLLNAAEFWLPFPVPSVSASEPSFDPDYSTGLIWRGPTWINTNWFLIKALSQHGYTAMASTLADKTLSLLGSSGLREFYNPRTGEGYGAHDFGWSALVLDLLG